MFGVRFASLFTSRWMALLWALLVILTAIGFVGAGSDQPAGQPTGPDAADTLTPEQQQAIANAF